MEIVFKKKIGNHRIRSKKNKYYGKRKKRLIATSIWNQKKKNLDNFLGLRFDTVVNFFDVLLLIPSLIISMYGYIENPLFATASTS